MEVEQKQYDEYVKKVTPPNHVWLDMVKAFVTGGIICTIAQALTMWLMNKGIGKDDAAAWTLLALIAGSIILTGLNIYPKIVKWGGAGALVPITGFANSVVAPAIEYKADE